VGNDHDSNTPLSTELTRADEFWTQLHRGKGRFGLVGALVLIWFLHTLLTRHLISGGYITTQLQLLDKLELLGTFLFVVSSLLIIYAILLDKLDQFSKVIALYLAYAVFQVVLNVISMLGTANAHQGGGLTSLWDVGLFYLMSVLVFTFVSMNVNSTYGPTNEAIMSRVGKLVMAFQVPLAVSMLTVLIARAVASTS